MKKILLALFILVLMFAFVACNSDPSSSNSGSGSGSGSDSGSGFGPGPGSHPSSLVGTWKYGDNYLILNESGTGTFGAAIYWATSNGYLRLEQQEYVYSQIFSGEAPANYLHVKIEGNDLILLVYDGGEYTRFDDCTVSGNVFTHKQVLDSTHIITNVFTVDLANGILIQEIIEELKVIDEVYYQKIQWSIDNVSTYDYRIWNDSLVKEYYDYSYSTSGNTLTFYGVTFTKQ